MQYSALIRKKDKGYQYVISYKIDGKWKTKSKQGFPLNKAGKELAKIEMDKSVLRLKDELKNEIDSEMIGITFLKFSEMYLDHMSLYREQASIRALKTAFNRFSGLNNIEITKISLMDIQSLVDGMTRDKLNTNTIKEYITKLNTLFYSAINEYNLIQSLPTKNLKIAKDKIDTNKRALTKIESDELLKLTEKSRYYLVILIALKCGLRIGEILGLTWTNIDEINHVVKVTAQWKVLSDGNYGLGSLKSKNSYREVPISPSTLAILNNSKKIINLNGRIFNFRNTSSTSTCLSKLFKDNGYNISIHELRHTYATTLISNGVDFKTAARFLGHTVEQTMKTYSHVNDDMIKKATSIINRIL